MDKDKKERIYRMVDMTMQTERDEEKDEGCIIVIPIISKDIK